MRIVVRRGGVCECIHQVHCVEITADGVIGQVDGNPDFFTTLRSSGKPLQALPLVLLDRHGEHGLNDEELAICCGSHSGSPRHYALAASVLALSGFLPDDLVCGMAGDPPSPLKHGCSGNHAALLLGAKLLGAPLEGYHLPEHPIQQYIRGLLESLTKGYPMKVVVDGCGVPTFAMSLTAMALLFAAIAQKAHPAQKLLAAMGKHPELVGSERWADVPIMQVTQGRIIAKTGAEGLLCLCIPGEGRGVAIKTEDGNMRAIGPATIEFLQRLGWITPSEVADLRLASLKVSKISGSTPEAKAEVVVS